MAQQRQSAWSKWRDERKRLTDQLDPLQPQLYVFDAALMAANQAVYKKAGEAMRHSSSAREAAIKFAREAVITIETARDQVLHAYRRNREENRCAQSA